MMVKKPYAKPVILRVVLNPEQAVLAQCSQGVTTVRVRSTLWCRPSTAGTPCRKASSGTSANSAAGS